MNSVQNIAYKNDLARWHYIYFGYSRDQRLAFAQVQFKSRTESQSFKDHNHFVPNKFSLYVAKDKWHAAYSGQIAYLNFNAGAGAFATKDYDKAKDDIFGFSAGKGTLIKPPIKFDLDKNTDKKIVPSP